MNLGRKFSCENFAYWYSCLSQLSVKLSPKQCLSDSH